jgi:acid phosphatase family membrane protein YuiD
MIVPDALRGMLRNPVLLATFGAWLLAQIVKVPIDRARTGRTNWALLTSAGGMPSSHAALVWSLATATGIQEGFSSAVFAVTVVLALVVSYDAAGIRRAAGQHANVINRMIDELAHGHPLREEQLKEILGHSPVEVLAGALFGVFVGWAVMRV